MSNGSILQLGPRNSNTSNLALPLNLMYKPSFGKIGGQADNESL